MERYSKITNKNRREIVLLKAFPCAWGKCAFCDYTDDNSSDEESMITLNEEVLSRVTGEFGVLEVINSGSCFELPKKTLEKIRNIIREKKIKHLFFEAHWLYRHRLEELKEYMGIPITFKIGVESFDFDFREGYLNKNAKFQAPSEVSKYFASVCLMVGIKGQTKEMIDRDIEYMLTHFERGTVNVFVNNTTKVQRDDELVTWFCDKYAYLDGNPNVEVLYNNIDFGVGD